MDAVAPLAGQLVQVLTPFLPFLVKAGERIGPQVEQKGMELASTLWTRLSSQLEKRPAAQEAAADLAKAPSDEDAQAALRVQLRKLLAEDPALQKEIEALLKDARDSGSITTVNVSGDRSVGIGRDVSGSTIITGDQGKTQPRQQ